MLFFHLECWAYWISATSYFLDKVTVASRLTISDSEPGQLVGKNTCKTQRALEDSFKKAEYLLENNLRKTKRKSKFLIYPEKFQGEIFTK